MRLFRRFEECRQLSLEAIWEAHLSLATSRFSFEPTSRNVVANLSLRWFWGRGVRTASINLLRLDDIIACEQFAGYEHVTQIQPYPLDVDLTLQTADNVFSTLGDTSVACDTIPFVPSHEIRVVGFSQVGPWYLLKLARQWGEIRWDEMKMRVVRFC